jgi:hypothetical protein
MLALAKFALTLAERSNAMAQYHDDWTRQTLGATWNVGDCDEAIWLARNDLSRCIERDARDLRNVIRYVDLAEMLHLTQRQGEVEALSREFESFMAQFDDAVRAQFAPFTQRMNGFLSPIEGLPTAVVGV